MSWRDRFRGSASWWRDLALGISRNVSNAAADLAWAVLWDVVNARNELDNWIAAAQDSSWLRWIPSWGDLLGWIREINSRVFLALIRVPTWGINWFNDRRDDGTGEFWWTLWLQALFDSLVDQFTAIGEFFDGVPALLDDRASNIMTWLDQRMAALRSELLDLLLGTASPLFELVGWALMELERLLRGSGSNAWSGVKAVWPTWGERFASVARILRDTVQWRLDSLLDVARDVASALVAVALFPINAWIAEAQGALDWVRQSAGDLQDFLDDPLDYIWSRWEDRLWPRVESWLIKLWDGVA